jgi:hypothetical protein
MLLNAPFGAQKSDLAPKTDEPLSMLTVLPLFFLIKDLFSELLFCRNFEDRYTDAAQQE